MCVTKLGQSLLGGWRVTDNAWAYRYSLHGARSSVPRQKFLPRSCAWQNGRTNSGRSLLRAPEPWRACRWRRAVRLEREGRLPQEGACSYGPYRVSRSSGAPRGHCCPPQDLLMGVARVNPRAVIRAVGR